MKPCRGFGLPETTLYLKGFKRETVSCLHKVLSTISGSYLTEVANQSIRGEIGF